MTRKVKIELKLLTGGNLLSRIQTGTVEFFKYRKIVKDVHLILP